MSDDSTETLTVHLEDDASNAADSMTTALDRLTKAQDAQAKAGIGGRAGDEQVTAFNRLRDAGAKAGSAIGEAMSKLAGRTKLTAAALGNLAHEAAGFAMPQLINEGARLRALQKDTDALAASMKELEKAKEKAILAGVKAAEKAEKAAETERKQRLQMALDVQKLKDREAAQAASALEKAQREAEGERKAKLGISLAVQKLKEKEALEASRVTAAREKEAMALGMSSLNNSTKDANADRANAAKREAEAVTAGLDTLKAASKEADAIRAHDEASALASANRKAKADDAAYQKAIAREERNEKAKSAIKEAHLADIFEKANKLPKSLQPQQAEPQMSGLQKLLGTVRSVFGDKAAGGLAAGAQKLAEVDESMGGKLLPALAAGAGAYGAAAAVIVTAATALAAITYKVLSAVASASIEASDRKTKALAGLGEGGEETYEIALATSVRLGSDLDATITQAKGLITTGFAKDRVPVILEAVADIRVKKGDDAANALQKGLEKVKAKGKFGSEAVDGLAEAGIRSELIYKALAKSTGDSMAIVQAKVKAGQIDVEKGIEAILSAANEQSGGAAGKAADTVGDKLKGVRLLATALFNDKDATRPLKNALDNAQAVLTGPGGGKLKTAITGLSTQLFKTLFGPFEGPEGAAKLERFIGTITRAAESATTALAAAAPYVRAFVDEADALINGNADGDSSTIVTVLKGIHDYGSLALIPIRALGIAVDAMIYPFKLIGASLDQAKRTLGGEKDAKLNVPTFGDGTLQAAALAGGQTAGQNLASGFKTGILAGTAGAVSAAIDMAKAALFGVASPAGQDSHSPSKKAAKLGGDFGQGYAIQIKNSGAAANDAGAALAMRAVGGAAQESAPDLGELAPPGGRGGGAGVTFNITVTGGTPEQNKKAGQEIGDASYARWNQHFGRKMRDTVREAG